MSFILLLIKKLKMILPILRPTFIDKAEPEQRDE